MWICIVLFGANRADDGHAKEKRGKIISFDISARERDVTSFFASDATCLISTADQNHEYLSQKCPWHQNQLRGTTIWKYAIESVEN